MTKNNIILTLLLLCSLHLLAQEDFGTNVKANKLEEKKTPLPEVKRSFDAGVGIGLDYGGLGFKGTYTPLKFLGVFASAGYQIVAFGWQVGALGYILPKTNLKRVRPCLKAMFGTNRAIFVQGASQYNKNYTGFTPGAGVEFRFGAKAAHGLNIDLNVPINSAQFNEDLDALKNNPAIDISNPAPVAFSFGYHFEF